MLQSAASDYRTLISGLFLAKADDVSSGGGVVESFGTRSVWGEWPTWVNGLPGQTGG